ncbi:tRNA pseudouridine synthase B [Caloranaerobacter azorensis H53214]|uniref:tRNA pseudouridine synthase B n=1 Tax=Caloranaerobacter azorensis H53214 TaxID=1156417 RepID=A0A096DNK5_9FIRM|nr:tRNA pseudouridine(55) synthase TruB [Caloranaerobacter azorensis]KGG80851.1 tRNA pseudouridine synthase B [Caloranaerobacter azorensis H53214]
MNGLINILKPTGMSSHDVVNFIRKTLKVKKVGHTGTLDPNAAGVLPICLGKATRISEYLIDKTKEYRAELTLGCKTDTQDKYGNVICSSNNKVTEADIIKAFNSFIGEIEQIPPMFSAVKYKGKKLYELARSGIEIPRKPRKVIIYDIKIIDIKDCKKVLFDVKCSKGTYIRTLCNDIGDYLNTYGYMSFLLRTKVGNFSICDSFTIEEIEELSRYGKINTIIKPIDYALEKFKSINFESKHYKRLINGGSMSIDDKKCRYKHFDLIRVYCNNEFIGVGKVIVDRNKKYVRMEKVLI